MTIVRRGLAVLGGVVAASLTIAATEALIHFALTGRSMFVAVVVGYGLGSVVGTAAATYFSDRKTSLAVPAVLAALATVNLFAFPHPGWFMPAAALTLLLGWVLGSRLEPRSGRRNAETGR